MSNWKDFVTLSPVGEGVQQVYFRNGAFIGNVIQDVDGYWKYAFPNSHGLWEDGMLEMLATMLTELNKPWDDDVRSFFENERAQDEQGT
jgi:hypothetical protein